MTQSIEPIRVVVADDHPLFREGVVASLRSNPDIEVVGQAEDAAGALRIVREELPDLVLLDVTMPGGGVSAAAQIASACPATRIVMLTVFEDEDDLLSAMKAGASGYVLKGVSASDLARVVGRGGNGGEVELRHGADDGAAGGSAQDWTYAPAQLTTTVGTTLTWTNAGAEDHTATSDDRTSFDSRNLSPHGTFSFTPTTAGMFA